MTPHEVIQKINQAMIDNDLEGAEKALEEFASVVFDTGASYGMDVCISLDNAEEPTKPDKETYLKLLFTNQKQNEGV